MALQRNAWILGTLTIAIILGAPARLHPDEKKPRLPNIIFILADDLGYGELGCFGQEKIKTPNLDRLAARGMRLTQHYAGNAVCAPSRCTLLTGKHPGHAYIRDNLSTPPEGQHPLPEGTVTLARLLRLLGYITGAFGKWGLGGPDSPGVPDQQGFDRFFGHLCQGKAHNSYPPYLWDNRRKVLLKNPAIQMGARLAAGADPKDPASYQKFQGREYSPDVIGEQALKFIRDNKDRPFFLYVPTTVPHLALQVPNDSLEEYLGKWDDPPYVGGKGYLPHRAPRAAYAAMVTRMDREVGRIMALIDELGLDDDTIFIFTSDNGPLEGRYAGTDSIFFYSTRGLRGYKGSLFEGGIRVPCIVAWRRRIPAGTASSRVTGFEDWLPTLLELTGNGKSMPRDLDGISFAPTLLGKAQARRPFLYREFPGYGGYQLVRLGDWTGIRQHLVPAKNARPDLHIALYNLRDDPGQQHDVSAQHPDIVAQIEQLFREQHTPSATFPISLLDR
jgi:arylsulfatase A-like enzyme